MPRTLSPPFQARLTPSRIAAIAVTSAGLFAGGAVAQSTLPPSTLDLTDRGLETTPLTVEALGFSINPPAGSTARAEQTQGHLSIVLNDRNDLQGWTLRIQPLTSSLVDPSPAAQIEQHLRVLGTRKIEYTLISNGPVSYGGADGHLCYISQRTDSGQEVISGWFVVTTAPGQFLVMSLVSTAEVFSRIQPSLEASFSTLTLLDREMIRQRKQAHLETGRSFIESLTPDDLAVLIGLKEWFRIYLPADQNPEGTGEKEVGYSLIEVIEGKRGLLNPQRDEHDYSAAENTIGLMVRVQGRLAVNVAGKDYYDSIAVYWLAWDQSEEAWSIRATRRQGDAEQTEAETGVRTAATTGSPRSTLSVIRGSESSRDRKAQDWEVPPIYLSQALGWLIGPLLARSEAPATEFKYYFYNFATDEPRLAQRLDVWAPTDDGLGNWTLTTKLTVDGVPHFSIYAPDGRLIRRTRTDGPTTEPIDPARLRRLWLSKGLQFGGGR